MPALLAYVAEGDIRFGELSRYYAQPAAAGASHQARPIRFPVADQSAQAQQRVAYLGAKLGQDRYSVSVAGAPAAMEAQRIRDAARWYAVSQGRDSCTDALLSPADRIKLVREAGVTPRVRDTMVAGKLSMIEIVADDGRHETTWRFWKSKSDCERTLLAKAIPDRYK